MIEFLFISFLVVDCSFYKVDEERMRVEHCALVLGMELCSDVPFECWNLHNLYEITLWIGSHTLHSVSLILLDIVVVKLIAVAVTLLNMFILVDVERA